AKKLAPKTPSVLDTLGWAYYKRGDIDRALENILQAVKLGTNEADVYYHLGLVYMKKGMRGKAREAFRKALELNPKFDKADEIRRLLGGG
ncbi:hypothetical protein DRP77_00195, partial [Candidatus Poribacteria bacterium]